MNREELQALSEGFIERMKIPSWRELMEFQRKAEDNFLHREMEEINKGLREKAPKEKKA